MKNGKFQKLKEKIIHAFEDESRKEIRKMAESDDPLGYKALNNAIDRLIERENSLESQLEDKTKSSNEHRIVADSEPTVKTVSTILDNKVEQFIKWYSNNIVKGDYGEFIEYREPENMRNFIEKIAIWYELRYPDYEINKIMPGSGQEQKNINEVMFKNNPYINELLGEDSDICYLDWDEFYNAKSFIDSLTVDEKIYFSKPKYTDIVFFDKCNFYAHFHLTKNGIIEFSEGIQTLGTIFGVKITNEELEGKHIKEAVSIMEERGIVFPESSEIKLEIKRYDNKVYQKEEMLNCVMYRIIERGKNRIGPRRAFLFAKEFKRNIDIPIIYGIDYSDPGLKAFINEYIKSGGKKDLLCHVNYFSKKYENEKLDTVSIQEIIKNVDYDYTLEELLLYQRLINSFATRIDYDELKKEEIISLRLKRKIEKSKRKINKN